MPIDERAKYLDEMYSGLFDGQAKVVADIEALFIRWDAELEPIKRVMRKYKLYYRNANYPGKTALGAVLGVTNKHPQRLLVLYQGLVCPVNAENDEAKVSEAMTLSEFIAAADLSKAKAGFDYVRNLGSPEANPIAERNRELTRFFEEAGV